MGGLHNGFHWRGEGEGKFGALELARYLTPKTCVSVVALKRFFRRLSLARGVEWRERAVDFVV